LVQKYGSLRALAQAPLEELQTVKGIGRDKAVTLAAAFTLARKMAKELRGESPVLDTPEAVANLMREDARLRSVETFQVLLLNTRRRLIDVVKVSDGTLDTILVHPREVFKPAIAANAAAVVLLHNHPSGEATPSEADIKVTRDLIRAGQLLKIEVLDHVILGRATPEQPKDYVSLRELGYFAGS
jgi:DNA repair protein RadC